MTIWLAILCLMGATIIFLLVLIQQSLSRMWLAENTRRSQENLFVADSVRNIEGAIGTVQHEVAQLRELLSQIADVLDRIDNNTSNPEIENL